MSRAHLQGRFPRAARNAVVLGPRFLRVAGQRWSAVWQRRDAGSCKAGVPLRMGSKAERAWTSLMRLAQRCERVEDSGDPERGRGARRNRPKLRLDISQCVAEIAMFAGKPFNSS